jgi:hypothetical protein
MRTAQTVRDADIVTGTLSDDEVVREDEEPT